MIPILSSLHMLSLFLQNDTHNSRASTHLSSEVPEGRWRHQCAITWTRDASYRPLHVHFPYLRSQSTSHSTTFQASHTHWLPTRQTVTMSGKSQYSIESSCDGFALDALFEERLEVFPAEPSSVLSSKGHATGAIKSLIKERDTLQMQVSEQAETIKTLEHRIYSNMSPDAQLPVEVVRRLHLLENDYQRLRKENVKLNENLRAAESEAAILRDTVADKSQKVKGAMKKTKNAKESTLR